MKNQWKVLMSVAVAVVALLGWQVSLEASNGAEAPQRTASPDVAGENLAKATFAGGCFWCMEPPYDKLEGVHATISGYAGGTEKDPTYKQVAGGKTSHAEVVQVTYDPKQVTYERLLEVFWRNIDPTVENRQFCDGGSQYRTAIYAHDDAQLAAAKASLAALEKSERFARIVTQIEPLDVFYEAEDYHQDFYKKNPEHYYRYRQGCRRDARLQQLWGDEAGG